MVSDSRSRNNRPRRRTCARDGEQPARAVPQTKNTGGSMTRIEGVPARSALGQRELAPSYTLFRSEDKPDLYCAVPEDRAVPVFVQGDHWTFVGRITRAAALPGFQEEQARSGVRLNGFYLFMAHHTGFSAAAHKSTLELCAA